MRYFLHLSYDGSGFHGWQRQPNASSVQQTVEEALAVVFRRPVPIVGAGRTDAGVHARCMYAHFDCDNGLPVSKERLIASLRRLCGRNIGIIDLFEVPDELHARFSAVEREYRYFVSFSPSVFERQLSWHTPVNLNVEAMNCAAGILLHTDDFTSFAKLHADARTNICKVTKAVWEPRQLPFDQGPGLVFIIKSDRFLRNMVRAVVGTLVDVGRGKLSLSEFRSIIEKKDRCAAGTSMPAHALYLWNIAYPNPREK